ncbi:aminoglycoside phosphotransferase (APT) family kinase protein [Nocardiopsis arvandica]|uniref:Aminoglycoside phosphotransferase (APT) family kinase protein n=1 Tax=Nocardiopsis sinuspersici TaxID=501010 RepID=A0A7Y9X8A6_9ACTN|nr:aminoglycoside phosphotransferase (APT) family kinase protein [Nocardiopsis sinuspersici]
MQDTAAVEWDRPAVWVHGGLHPANAVVAGGILAGVVDFGELCASDPATDLSAAWLLLPAGAATRLFDAYAGAGEAAVRRARGWALMRCMGLLEIGRSGELGPPGGKRTWKRAGAAALDRLSASLP